MIGTHRRQLAQQVIAGKRRIRKVGLRLRLRLQPACLQVVIAAIQIQVEGRTRVEEIEEGRVAAARREGGAAGVGGVERDGDARAVLITGLVGALVVVITRIDGHSAVAGAAGLVDR